MSAGSKECQQILNLDIKAEMREHRACIFASAKKKKPSEYLHRSHNMCVCACECFVCCVCVFCVCVCVHGKREKGVKGEQSFKNMADEMKKEKLRKKITFISASAWRSILLAADMLYQLLSFFTSC
jgi:hypothetical protein